MTEERLTQTDAFFVAYQERECISMHFGVEVLLKGKIERDALEKTASVLLTSWPRLGQKLRVGLFGLFWSGIPRARGIVFVAPDATAEQFRNQPIDPFRECPFQVLWTPDSSQQQGTIAFRCHHAMADGTAFLTLVGYFLQELAKSNLSNPNDPNLALRHEPPRPLAAIRMIGAMLRYLRQQGYEARVKRSTRLAIRSKEGGNIGVVTHIVANDEKKRLSELAREWALPVSWVFAAAWAKAIHLYNVSMEAGQNPLVSLEIPVSILKGSRHRAPPVGNPISALTLFANTEQNLEDVARSLFIQFARLIRSGAHLGVPFFSNPWRYLPWALFRRLAVNDTSTGFATSHFTWLSISSNLEEEVISLSDRNLEILGFEAYTPVCFDMGAGLMVIERITDLTLTLSHRTTALTTADAERLLVLVAQELRNTSPLQVGEENPKGLP